MFGVGAFNIRVKLDWDLALQDGSAYTGQPYSGTYAFGQTEMLLSVNHEVAPAENARFNKGIVLLHDLKDKEGAVAAWEGLLEINPVAVAPNGQSVDELIQQYR